MKGLHRINSLQFLAIGFALLILTGSILLMFPVANRSGHSIPFLDALFTATSATCVTGLTVFDTYTQFTLFGQIIILILIQIGGLGFMMVAILFSMLIGRRIGLKERSLLMESVSVWNIGGVVRMTRRVLIGTAMFELTGTVLLATRFCPRFGMATGLWYSLFHSVSAFCNAGFDLMGILKPNSSLTLFAGDVIVNLTIVSLIMIGGLGFFLWNDISEKKWHFSKYRLHTKIMLSATVSLVVISAVTFYFTETDYAFAGMNVKTRVLASLFQAVTPRTAGYNTVDLTALSPAGNLLTMLLMFIGAGPGSTAGGLKITTVVVLLLAVIANTHRCDDMNIFGRRLEEHLLKRAASSATLYIILALAGTSVLCLQNIGVNDAMFQSLSALGTVGLSIDITSQMLPLSRIAMILLMYAGRIGSLSIAMAVVRKNHKLGLRNTVEKIIIG